MLVGPTKVLPESSHDNAKWFRLNVATPTRFHTPMQKLLVIGARPEFINSVPSSCHVAKPSSMTRPSGVPLSTMSWMCHSPTIGAGSSHRQSVRMNEALAAACTN